MALTLAQAELYTTNMVYAGVIDEFYAASPIFTHLGFIDIVGNAYQYLRESTRGNAPFRGPLETWTESTPTQAQVTVALKILGDDADIDHFLKKTRSNHTDIEGEIIAGKARDMKFGYLDAFWYGDDSVNNKEFDGMQLLIPSGNRIGQGSSATGAALQISNIDAVIDEIEGYVPDILVTTKAVRRRINAYIRLNGGTYMESRDEWGNMVGEYNGVPLYVDDRLVNTETIATSTYSAKTGGSTSSLFAMRFDEKAIFGIQNGALEIKKVSDDLETKDGGRWRLKWYCGLGLGSTVSGAAVVDGILSSTAVVS